MFIVTKLKEVIGRGSTGNNRQEGYEFFYIYIYIFTAFLIIQQRTERSANVLQYFHFPLWLYNY
jgi:hypothetical protein